MATRNLTEGSVLGNIASFSVPYLAAYFLQMLYGLADLFIIGQYEGVESITAVSVGSQVMHFLTVMIVGLAMGPTVMVARAVGARNENKASTIVGSTASIFLALSLLAAGVMLLCLRPVVGLMSTPSEAVEGTCRYLTITFAGIPFIAAYNVVAAIYRGLGDSRTPMYFVALSCALNIALDYLFIGAMGMGPSGAALGTTLSQTFSVLIALVYTRLHGLGIALRRSDFRPHRHIFTGIARTGGPVALQDGIIQVAFLVITVIANRRGLDDAAAVGIVEKIISMLFLVPSAMLSTVSTMVAQNMGAGLVARARTTLKDSIFIAVGYGAVVALLMQFLAGAAVGLFTSDPEVVRLGAQYLRSYSVDTAMAGFHFCFSGCFIASGWSVISFVHNISSAFLVRVPLTYLLSTSFPDTLYPMGWASPCGSLFSSVICIAAYLILRRKGRL